MHSKKQDSLRKKNPKKKNNNEALKSIAKYGGIAFQFAGLGGLGFWGGLKLDNHLNNEKPVFAAIFSIVGLALAMYLAIKDFIKKP